jgi:hypothetical protein
MMIKDRFMFRLRGLTLIWIVMLVLSSMTFMANGQVTDFFSFLAQVPQPQKIPAIPAGGKLSSKKLPCSPELVAKLDSPSAKDEDFFGSALAMTEDTLWVGAPGDDTANTNVGAVYVYLKTGKTWTLDDVLLPGDADAEQNFGWSLAIDEDDPETLVIGSPGDGDIATDAGAVYVFVRDMQGNWIEQDKLAEADTPEDARFGSVVDVDGDTIIAGAPLEDNVLGNLAGNAYVYEGDGQGIWTLKDKLFPPGSSSGIIFGSAVAVDRKVILVGAPYLGMQFVAGSAYAYSRTPSGWELDQKLSGLLSTGRDRFGSSAVLADGVAAIGSPRDGVPPVGLVTSFQYDQGMAARTSWTPIQYFFAPDFTVVDRFGSRLALSGSRLLVSATNHNEQGAAYLYDFENGKASLSCKISAPDGAACDLFGSGLALAGDMAAIGAPYHDAAATDDGSVYLFDLSRPGPLVEHAWR